MSKTVDEYLNTVSYADNDTYVPSEFSLMVVNLIKQINGETGEENKTPVVHFKMLDNMIKPGNVANLCHRGLAKTTLFGEYMLPIIAILGGLPGFGDIKYALYVADSIENGVRSMRKNLEYRYENSPFLKKYLKAKFTETSWEFTNVDGHQLVVDAFGAKTGIRGTKKLGTRPQLLILDDLLSDDDARSPVVLKSVEDTLTRAIKYAMHPHSKIIWCGTPFNKKDPLYRAVESGIYNVNVYPICEKFPCSKSEFRGSWEDRFPYEYVKKQYEEAKALGAISSFNQELMLRIMTDEERLILDSDIMWYSRKLLLQHKDDYNFYAMKAKPGVNAKEYFSAHFRDILGKAYCPFNKEEIFSLALDNKDPEGDNDSLLADLRKYFYVVDCKLGRDPIEVIHQAESEDSSLVVSPDKPGVLFVKVDNFGEELSKFSNTGRYAVGIYTDKMDSMMIIKYLGSIGFIMFNVDNREYHLFGLKGTCDVR